MKEKKPKVWESIKVEAPVLNKVRKHVKKTKQTLGGFFQLAAEEKMQRDLMQQGYVVPDPNNA